MVRILELGIRADRFCHIADTEGHGVMSDKALPALGADADKVVDDDDVYIYSFFRTSSYIITTCNISTN